MTHPLSDRVTVILGAASETGAAIARRFLAEGSRVVLGARDPDRLQSLADQIDSGDGELLAVVTDPTVYPQVKNLVDRAVETFGRVDVMVNAAGFGVLRPLEDASPQEIDDQIDLNVKGVCYGSKAVLGVMKAQRAGTIINIGSIASTQPFRSFAVYTASKHAVLGFSRSLDEEVHADGIRVNVLCPPAMNLDGITLDGSTEVPWNMEDLIEVRELVELALACATTPANIHLDSMVTSLSARTT